MKPPKKGPRPPKPRCEDVVTITTDQLDETDALDLAIKNLINAALASGRIPINCLTIALHIQLSMERKGEEFVDDPLLLARIALSDPEREIALSGISTTWVDLLKKMVVAREQAQTLIEQAQTQPPSGSDSDDSDSDDSDDSIDYSKMSIEEVLEETQPQLVSRYFAVRDEFVDALKVCWARDKHNNRPPSDDSAGVNILRSCLREAKSTQNEWAFAELFQFPKAYLQYAFYKDSL